MIGGILGIAMIVFGYYMAMEMFTTFKNLMMVTPFIVIFLTVVGAYLFFRSSVSLIFKTAKRAKNGRVSITDVVSTSSIIHRMKKNAMSLTIIAVISAITVTILCFAAITQSQTNYTMESMTPQDFNISESNHAEKFEDKLHKAHIPFEKKVTETINPKNVKDEVMTMGDDTHVANTSTLAANSKLKGNEAKLTNIKSMPSIVQIHNNKEITVKGKEKKTVKVTQIDKDKVYP